MDFNFDYISSGVKDFYQLENDMRTIETAHTTYIDESKPILIRVDGHSFRTFTKGFEKPFDDVFRNAMKLTMQAMCSEISNAVFGYTTSDEITIVVIQKNDFSSIGFNGRLEKLIGLMSAKATRFFNKFFMEQDVDRKFENKYFTAEFDAKINNFEPNDMVRNIIWRQADAMRNSIESVARTYFTQKELDNVNVSGMLDMLKNKGIIWDDYGASYKWGAACYKVKSVDFVTFVDKRTNEEKSIECERNKWIIDDNMPRIKDDKNWFVDKVKGE